MTAESHISEDQLELYALGRLEGDPLERCEEHILLCEECTSRLESWDDFVRSMKTAARQLEAEPEPAWKRWLKAFSMPRSGVLVAAGACAALALAVLVRIPRSGNGGVAATEIVTLAAQRGGTTLADAGHPLDLRLNADGLPGGDCEEELVSESGGVVATHEDHVTASGLRFEIPRPLAAGIYFVRVYQNHHTLAREYSIRLH